MNARELLRNILDELGGVTDEPGRLTRTFLSPAMDRALKLVGGWMRDVGLEVRVDRAGNVIGRRPGAGRGAKTLVLGSHLDTVRDAGKYDGALGVLLPIAALHELNRRGRTLPFGVEVVGFSEEEGVRFPCAYLGSEAYTGRFKAANLGLTDAAGISLRQALEKWGGLSRNHAKRVGGDALHLGPAHKRGDLLGYLEVHIEQGPVLEQAGLSVGVVSAIAGQSRFQLTWLGRAGHAGTTPMALRRDALAGAAEFTLAVERLARRTPGLVATVGLMNVAPGAANVIPGKVGHSLDVRHAQDAVRRRALLELGRAAARIARGRGLKVAWRRTQDHGAVECAEGLTARLDRSVRAVQGRSLSLVSGAGHDAVVVSRLTDVAMLFVRCRAGVSHHPDEHVADRDLGVALRVVVDFLENFVEQRS